MGQARFYTHSSSIGIVDMLIIAYTKHPRTTSSSPTEAAKDCQVGEGVECGTQEEANDVSAAMRKLGCTPVRRLEIQVFKRVNKAPKRKYMA